MKIMIKKNNNILYVLIKDAYDGEPTEKYINMDKIICFNVKKDYYGASKNIYYNIDFVFCNNVENTNFFDKVLWLSEEEYKEFKNAMINDDKFSGDKE
jgi:hypothetical protein